MPSSTSLLRQLKDGAYGIIQLLIIHTDSRSGHKNFDNDFDDNINLWLENKRYKVADLLTFIFKINKILLM